MYVYDSYLILTCSSFYQYVMSFFVPFSPQILFYLILHFISHLLLICICLVCLVILFPRFTFFCLLGILGLGLAVGEGKLKIAVV